MVALLEDLPLSDFRPLVAGIVAWTIVFYVYMSRQSGARLAAKKRFVARLKRENDGKEVDLTKYGNPKSMSFLRGHPDILQDSAFIRADRSFLNMVEQGVPLFVGVFLYSLVVDVKTAGYVLIAYTASRVLYGPLYNNPLLLMAAVTVPNYLEVLYLIGRPAYAVFA